MMCTADIYISRCIPWFRSACMYLADIFFFLGRSPSTRAPSKISGRKDGAIAHFDRRSKKVLAGLSSIAAAPTYDTPSKHEVQLPCTRRRGSHFHITGCNVFGAPLWGGGAAISISLGTTFSALFCGSRCLLRLQHPHTTRTFIL